MPEKPKKVYWTDEYGVQHELKRWSGIGYKVVNGKMIVVKNDHPQGEPHGR